MKKKKWWIPVTILVVAALVCAAGIWYAAANSLSFSTGRLLMGEDGPYMLILDDSPIVMSGTTKTEERLRGWDSGDKILVLHDGIQESYPGGTGAYLVFKLEDGDITDIPETVLETLTALGWWTDSDG